MNFKKFLRKYGVRLAAMVISVVLIVSVSSVYLAGQAGPLTNATGVVSTPIQSAVDSVLGWFESLYGQIYEYDKLLAENNALKAQLADAEERAREGVSAVEENEQLRELLGLKQKRTDFLLETARIVSWNSSNWSSSFSISKGEDAELAVGMPVITEAGELVGQISEIGDNWANVKTIIDVEIDVGVLVGEIGNPAMAIGDFELMQDGQCRIFHLTEGTNLIEGDIVMTSGRGGSFPSGLVLGNIESVLTEAGGQMPYGVLEPSVDLSSLSQVFIIKDFTVVE